MIAIIFGVAILIMVGVLTFGAFQMNDNQQTRDDNYAAWVSAYTEARGKGHNHSEANRIADAHVS